MTTMTANAASPLPAVLAAPFRVVRDFFVALNTAIEVRDEANTLYALNDEELAERGLTRDQISGYLVSRLG
ncbi:hypothetical protein ATO2_15810 [Roseovarius sp. 22II1-1F6A]|nr:hypothetical protein ATO2_15810 [Roseovarius sp. 22II1-1F6A]